MRPTQQIVKHDKVRAARDGFNPAFELSGRLVNTLVDYCEMDGFLSMLSPGALAAGLDFQDCFWHWLVSPACRRLLGVRHSLARRLGVSYSYRSALALRLDGTIGA